MDIYKYLIQSHTGAKHRVHLNNLCVKSIMHLAHIPPALYYVLVKKCTLGTTKCVGNVNAVHF